MCEAGGVLIYVFGCSQRPQIPSRPSGLQGRHIRHVWNYLYLVHLTSKHLVPWLPLTPSAAQSRLGPWPGFLPPSQYPWLLRCHPSAPK